MTDQFYYFGCVGDIGHRLTMPNGKTLYNPVGPWGWHIDGGLCPPGRQVQGPAALHHKDGWTALAFWDYSIDTRGGSNSVFLADETLTFDQMMEKAKAIFPQILARFKFEIAPLNQRTLT